MDLNLELWMPTITLLLGGVGLAWRAGGVLTELKTLLKVLTEDVVEVKVDVKQLKALSADVVEVKVNMAHMQSRLVDIDKNGAFALNSLERGFEHVDENIERSRAHSRDLAQSLRSKTTPRPNPKKVRKDAR